MKKEEKILITEIFGSIGFFIWMVSILILGLLFHARKALWEAPVPQKFISYEHMDWKSGDLLLCSGSGAHGKIGEIVTKVTSGSQWTHVGLVFVHPVTKHIYLWDIDNTAARLIPLFAFLKRYKGKVAVRRLVKSSFTDMVVINDEKYMEFIQSHWNVPYTHDFWIHGYNRKFPILAVPFSSNLTEEKKHFCCTLTAKTLVFLGVIKEIPHMHVLGMKDFEYDHDKNNPFFIMKNGWRFEPEILVKKDESRSVF